MTLNSRWKYAYATEAGAPLNWKTGLPGLEFRSQFGYGEGDEMTVLEPDMDAYYFTKKFDINVPSFYPTLELSLLADDGAVVYLNGEEVYRHQMPDGVITSKSRPTVWASGDAERIPVEVTISGEHLVAGVNVVAVEVHNFSTASRDLSFAMALVPS